VTYRTVERFGSGVTAVSIVGAVWMMLFGETTQVVFALLAALIGMGIRQTAEIAALRNGLDVAHQRIDLLVKEVFKQ
jgi:hypothetical protein